MTVRACISPANRNRSRQSWKGTGFSSKIALVIHGESKAFHISRSVQNMSPQVDLYDNAYSNYETDVYRQIRLATYGEDLGQTSWVTNKESREITQVLELSPRSYVLEIGCGSGRYALQIAETVGCRVVGVDINNDGIRNSNALADARNLSDRVHFERCDASQALPYPNTSFDAAFANDVMCHVPGRLGVLQELFRVLKPGGRLLFSDALVIGGTISDQEIATRSSIGYYLFSPPGHNEDLMRKAGFHPVKTSDTTENAAAISRRWREAREERRAALTAMEGNANFDSLQQFLLCVQTLTSERRLLRFLYFAQKPA